MGSAAKVGLLVLMGLVVALARYIEGEVKAGKSRVSPAAIAGAELIAAKAGADATPGSKPAVADALSGAQGGAPATASADPVAGRPYEIKKGETLQTIARRAYNSPLPKFWKAVLKANEETLRGDARRLRVGMKINLPSKESV